MRTLDSSSGYFSVESHTMKIEKVCGLRQLVDAVPYTSFPPSLCLPSIRSGKLYHYPIFRR
jgi:hypothetical protein